MAARKKPTTAIKKKTVKKRPVPKANPKPRKKKQTQKPTKKKTISLKQKKKKTATKPSRKKVAAPALRAKKIQPKTKGKKSGSAGKPSKTRRKPPVSQKPLRQDLLKKHLIQKREEIVKEAKDEIAKYVKGETNQLVETALDDGDWSVIDLTEDLILRRLETHRESLFKIDEALRKIREGTYGVCEDCGDDISAERLKVLPFAIFCRDCQEKREEIEKVTREEVI